MPLYHGTSAASALKIVQSGIPKPSANGFFYCFDSNRPESLAGALCFATGDGPRNGSLTQTKFFARYAALNPDFPSGLRGLFYKAALKKIASSWAKKQMESATSLLDRHAAILVFYDHSSTIAVTRQGFVNEIKIPPQALDTMNLERIFFDDALLDLPEIRLLHELDILIEPLSNCARHVFAQKAKSPDQKPAP